MYLPESRPASIVRYDTKDFNKFQHFNFSECLEFMKQFDPAIRFHLKIHKHSTSLMYYSDELLLYRIIYTAFVVIFFLVESFFASGFGNDFLRVKNTHFAIPYLSKISKREIFRKGYPHSRLTRAFNNGRRYVTTLDF